MKSAACDVCRGKDWALLYEKQILHPLWWLKEKNAGKKLRYYICQKCGYIALFPRLSFSESQDYYRLAPTPSLAAFATRGKLLGARKQFILRKLREALFNRIVEIGPAYGDFLRIMPEFKQRIGIEPSANYCQIVEDNTSPFEYHCCMLEDVAERHPELLESADLVVASHVLEHAYQPRKFVRDLIGLARPGGFIYIEVPSVEAMAELSDSAAQTIHFGHVSQFSAPVLNQLCVSEALDVVGNEISAREKYPLLRGLYTKPRRAEIVGEQFRRHGSLVDAQAIQAKQVLLKALSANKKHLVLWGCGDDLFGVLKLLSGAQLNLLAKRGSLVDMNPRKQNKRFSGLVVADPSDVGSASVGTVLICSRSKLLQSDIGRAAKALFGAAECITLFP